MAFQQSDLDKLDAAIASGVQQVTFADGRNVRYQTTADMLQARELISGSLAPQLSAATKARRRVIVGRVGRCR